MAFRKSGTESFPLEMMVKDNMNSFDGIARIPGIVSLYHSSRISTDHRYFDLLDVVFSPEISDLVMSWLSNDLFTHLVNMEAVIMDQMVQSVPHRNFLKFEFSYTYLLRSIACIHSYSADLRVACSRMLEKTFQFLDKGCLSFQGTMKIKEFDQRLVEAIKDPRTISRLITLEVSFVP
jgi:hypothetical protein